MITAEEKQYLKNLVKKNLDHFLKEKERAKEDATLAFIKSEEDYEMFLKNLLEKLA